jgi:hypothetical protein
VTLLQWAPRLGSWVLPEVRVKVQGVSNSYDIMMYGEMGVRLCILEQITEKEVVYFTMMTAVQSI